MTEYIERTVVCMEAGYIHGFGDDKYVSLKDIESIPAADVAPVVHGRWIDRSDKGVISMTHPYVCNRCGRVEMLKEPYCNCGARMDGE